MGAGAPLIGQRRRGQPVLVLVVVLLGWSGVRAMVWDDPQFAGIPPKVQHSARSVPHQAPVVPILGAPAMPMDDARSLHEAWMGQSHSGVASAPTPGVVASPAVAGETPDPDAPPAEGPGQPVSAAHQMLWMAAMANLPLPETVAADRRAAQPVADASALVVQGEAGHRRHGHGLYRPGTSPADGSRWSGDGWLLLRQGGGKPAASGNPYGPSYGANQVGAVLRYRLLASDPHKLNAFVRGYGAMNGTGEKEAAIGLSARPIARVPVVAMAEIRASRFMDGSTHARPAVTLVSELPPVRLTKTVEAELYVQGGYVGGAAATPFVDGQLRVEQVVQRLGNANLRVGLGAWGGAQDGVNRLDIGPTARLSWSNGHRAGARLAFDWRLRVEGNAQPDSGPALTLSAGF